MPIYYLWGLVDGREQYYGERDAAPEPEYEAQPQQGIRPYYPSRHEKMATGEELMALGINYTRE